MRRRDIELAAAATLVFLTTTCHIGSNKPIVRATVMREGFEPQPEDHHVELLTGDTQRPHILVGEISCKHKRDDMFFYTQTHSPAICLSRMKKAARKMGGDAIAKYDSHTASAGTVGSGTVSMQGLVIRWDDSATKPTDNGAQPEMGASGDATGAGESFADPAARLRQLKSLRKEGLISEKEFRAARQKVIDRLAGQ